MFALTFTFAMIGPFKIQIKMYLLKDCLRGVYIENK